MESPRAGRQFPIWALPDCSPGFARLVMLLAVPLSRHQKEGPTRKFTKLSVTLSKYFLENLGNLPVFISLYIYIEHPQKSGSYANLCCLYAICSVKMPFIVKRKREFLRHLNLIFWHVWGVIFSADVGGSGGCRICFKLGNLLSKTCGMTQAELFQDLDYFILRSPWTRAAFHALDFGRSWESKASIWPAGTPQF